jgi:DNA-binding NtrC family response regulator
MLNILIISDEAKGIASLFRSTGFTPDARDMKQASAAPEDANDASDHYDIVFLDLDADNWQERLLEARHSMPVIAFSQPDLHKAVEALKLGAGDYLEKPLTAEVISEVINRHQKKILSHKYGFDEIIGNSQPMQEVFGLIKKAAASESNVFITGESGTGKELIARAIHRWSPRSEKSFMTINCTAIPDTLLESELFGFEKGSFTGAQYTKKGLLEQADGGTVFFDEIGDVSPLFQTKVLRVLQEGEIMRIGGMRQIRVDLRFITATSRDLKTACQRGMFREDLFYRLNVFPILVPPLRERLEDIPLLVWVFVEEFTQTLGKRIDSITQDSLTMLLKYSWPGNIRELRNLVERAMIAATGPRLTIPVPHTTPAALGRSAKLVDVEREHIRAVLESTGWRIRGAGGAAERLGLKPTTLETRMAKLGINRPNRA